MQMLLSLLLLAALCSQGFSRKLIYFDHENIDAKNETFVIRELTTSKKGYGAICTADQIAKIDQSRTKC